MKRSLGGWTEGLKSHRLEIRHVTVLFIVLLIFQIIVSLLHKASLQKSLVHTQEWYQQDSAERLANLTATSLELLLESKTQREKQNEAEIRRIVQGFNIVLSQQILSQSVQEICILIPRDSLVFAVDDGRVLYACVFENLKEVPRPATPHAAAIALYNGLRREIEAREQIRTIVEGKQTFHVFVPFVPRGEFVGVVYMKNTPDFSFITREMTSSYDETTLTFLALILFGLLAMFYLSSYTLKERDDAQKLLFEKEKQHLTEQINHQKEMLFTKRIYHTHHKAEKVMGFIKDDLRSLSEKNIEDTKARVMKYSNFIARVIYDMKWYDPPIQTIRSPLFRTDLNDVLRFLVQNVVLRVSTNHDRIEFVFDLDDHLPTVPVNEFVAWEAFEPVIQNCLDHGVARKLVVTVRTRFDPGAGKIQVMISDNGSGIDPALLEKGDRGVERIFQEHVTTRRPEDGHPGYGCYIAHEIATQRCGWELDAENLQAGGCRFTFSIPHKE
jgi:signal transduction histidine kinase